jgi:hypothetical protein
MKMEGAYACETEAQPIFQRSKAGNYCFMNVFQEF